MGNKVNSLLKLRAELTDQLLTSPYDLIIYLRRARVHESLHYPDLAAGDAYRALLLTDEALNEGFEYHDQAIEALSSYINDADAAVPILLAAGLSDHAAGYGPEQQQPSHEELARAAALQCYKLLAAGLLRCGSLKSAQLFCEQGLAAAPDDPDLVATRAAVASAAAKNTSEPSSARDLPEWGLAPRMQYPWNTFEPRRYEADTIARVNETLRTIAPKCEVRITDLPALSVGTGDPANRDTAIDKPQGDTCRQLGLFACEPILAGEVFLRESSLLTAHGQLHEAVCDACGGTLPALGATSSSAPVACEECGDTVFCSVRCRDSALAQYHGDDTVCGRDIDVIAVVKDAPARDAAHALYLLLLVRALAMAQHQGLHPLELPQVQFIWGELATPPSGEESASTDDGDNLEAVGPPLPPSRASWTLPFSFKFNIEYPLHVLEKMDIDVFATLARYDLWVLNTLYAKFRGTASGRKDARTGRPEVAAVHPFWCLANHDCDPNATWEWGGEIVMWARETRVVGGGRGGIAAGEEILQHYCDVTLPVKERREWAMGALGGVCMCARCRSEAAAEESGPLSTTIEQE